MEFFETRSNDIRVLLKKLKCDYEIRLRDKNKIIAALEADNKRLKKINQLYSSERRSVLDMLYNKEFQKL